MSDNPYIIELFSIDLATKERSWLGQMLNEEYLSEQLEEHPESICTICKKYDLSPFMYDCDCKLIRELDKWCEEEWIK